MADEVQPLLASDLEKGEQHESRQVYHPINDFYGSTREHLTALESMNYNDSALFYYRIHHLSWAIILLIGGVYLLLIDLDIIPFGFIFDHLNTFNQFGVYLGILTAIASYQGFVEMFKMVMRATERPHSKAWLCAYSVTPPLLAIFVAWVWTVS